MHILVTGGAGFIGRALVPELLKLGHTITILTRNTTYQAPSGVNVFYGDLCDDISSKKAFKNQTCVIHLAGSKDESLSYDDLYTANVKATQKAIDYSIEANVRHFIHTSTIGVLGPTPQGGADEDLPYFPQTPYERSKCIAEQIVLEAGSSLRVTVFRPTMIYGVEEIWIKVFKKAKKGFPIIGSGSNFWHLVYVKDVVQAICLSIGNSASYGEVYNIADAQPQSYTDTYACLRNCLDKPPVELKIPYPVAMFLALFCEAWAKICRKKPLLSRSHFKRLTRARHIKIDKAISSLGYAPKYTNQEGLSETVTLLKQKDLL